MWVLALVAVLAAGPSYDAFSDPTGHISGERQILAAQEMVRNPEQLEAVYADAQKGNVRAARVFEELETKYFPDIGREVARREAAPECLLPVYRELSGRCIPNWAFLDFLRRDAPGGVRLRRAIATAYEAKARELAIDNQAIVASVNALLAVAVVKGVLPRATSGQTATAAGTVARTTIEAERASLVESGFIDPGRVKFTQDSIRATFRGGGSIDELAAGLRSGKVKPSNVPPVRLFERDGKLFTLDNRRLEAFRRAGTQVPYRKATPQEIMDEAWKFTTKNEGESVRVRGDGTR